MIATLEIGSVVVPPQARLEFSQTYTELNGQTFRRTADGSGVLRSVWSGKLRTTIAGKGWIPSSFDNLTAGASLTLKCAMPRSVSGATTTITLPAARRSDSGHTPVGFALLGEEQVESAITDITDNVATLTTVTGATGYRVLYLPQLSVVLTSVTTKALSEGVFDWQVEAEEL